MFVSSHLLAEIQQICEHLVVIETGRLLFQGGVDELLAALTGRQLALPPPISIARQIIEAWYGGELPDGATFE